MYDALVFIGYVMIVGSSLLFLLSIRRYLLSTEKSLAEFLHYYADYLEPVNLIGNDLIQEFKKAKFEDRPVVIVELLLAKPFHDNTPAIIYAREFIYSLPHVVNSFDFFKFRRLVKLFKAKVSESCASTDVKVMSVRSRVAKIEIPAMNIDEWFELYKDDIVKIEDVEHEFTFQVFDGKTAVEIEFEYSDKTDYRSTYVEKHFYLMPYNLRKLDMFKNQPARRSEYREVLKRVLDIHRADNAGRNNVKVLKTSVHVFEEDLLGNENNAPYEYSFSVN